MKPLSKNILSLTAADGLGRLLSFIAITYLARTLGAEAMGILAVGMAILAYTSITANAGLPILGTRFVASGIDNKPFLIKRICTARILLSLLSLTIAGCLLWVLLKDEQTRTIALLYLLSLIPSAFFLEWFFQGVNKMTTLAIGRILSMSVYLILILLFVGKQASLFYVPVVWLVSIAVQAVYLWHIYLKEKYYIKETTMGPLNLFPLIKKGIPLAVATLISQIILQFPILYIGFFESKENAGVYSVAFRVVVLLLVLDRVFYTVFFPAISRSVKHSPDQLEIRFNRILKYISTGTFYIATVFILAGNSIFTIIFGPQFHASGIIFQLLVIYFVITVQNSVFTFTMIALGKEKIYTQSLMIGGLVFFAIMLFPLPYPSTIIAPIGLIFFQVTSMLYMMRNLSRKISLKIGRTFFLPLLCTIVLLILYTQLGYDHKLLSLILVLITLPIFAIASGINRSDLTFLKDLLV